jgi:N-acetylmuramoyl-L-alanine amidase
MKLVLTFFFLFVLVGRIYAQQTDKIILVTKDGAKYIPAYFREGTLYFSIKHFADALSINYYFNEQTNKIELKFDGYLLKSSARNPYIILTNKTTLKQNVFQLPTSTYLIKSNIYLPLLFSINLFETAYGKSLTFEKSNKIIVSDTKPIDTAIDKRPSTSDKYNIMGIILDEKANGTQIRIKSNKIIPSYASSFKNNILTLIFRKVNADTEKLIYSGSSGVVKKVEAKNIGNDTQVKLTVGPEYSTSEVMNVDNSNDLFITIHNKLFTKNENPTKKDKWEFDVIVIDAGHGGKDAGAIGVNGVKEKDINIGIALKLGKLIEDNMKDVKVVYTRKTDVFIDLYKRGKIANEKNGKLFISIHCNSTPKKPSNAKGFEVYLLRPGRTKEAIAIAEFENSVINYEENPKRYEKLTDENFILVSMAHSSYMKYSERFAEFLHKEFDNHPSLNSRGVKQAGFYVLVGASMPSVLIESGFLSNSNDAKHLSPAKGQQKFAEFVLSAIKKYRESYELEMQNE